MVGAELEVEGHLLGHIHRRGHGPGQVPEHVRHLRARLEVERVRLEPEALLVRLLRARVDAEQDVLGLAVLVAQVVDVVGGHQGDPRALVQAHQGLVDLVLDLDAVALQLEPEVVGAEQVAQLDGHVLGLALLVPQEQLVDVPCQAAREARDPLGVPAQQVHVDARPEVQAVDERLAGQLGQVAEPRLVARDQGQVVVAVAVALAVPLVHRALGDVDLAAHQRLDPSARALGVELDRSIHVPVVRQGEGALTVLVAGADHVLDSVRAVEQRVLRVDMQVDEVGVRHGGEGAARLRGERTRWARGWGRGVEGEPRARLRRGAAGARGAPSACAGGCPPAG